MALPKPKSIFDEAHPVVNTGVTYAYPEGFFFLRLGSLYGPGFR